MSALQSRRRFLGRSVAGGLGLVLMHGAPAWAFGGRRTGRAYRERSFFTMGSVATVCAYGDSVHQIDHAVNGVIGEFRRLDDLLSVFNPASEIARLNAHAGRDAMALSEETIGLLLRAQELSRRTKGVFDITVEPLMRLWGFRGGRTTVPTDVEITQTLEAVGAEKLVVQSSSGEAGLLNRRSSLDLGGIAVGYAVDRTVEILRSEGIEDAFVNHAGDGYALGAPDDQDSWIAAVPDPKEPHSILRNISLTNRAISTSADNERSVTLRQARFGHIMDVRRGAPGTQAASMTVLAPSALEADALSTAAFCEPGILASMGGISFLAMRRQENGSLRIEERLNENGNHGIH